MKRITLAIALVLLTAAAAMPAWAQTQPAPKYSAKVPPYITTPDTVQTRIGTLKFFEAFPIRRRCKRSTTTSISFAAWKRFSAAYPLPRSMRCAKG